MSEWIETPLGAVEAGLAAGFAATLAMTAYQYLAQWLQGLTSGDGEDEGEGGQQTDDPWSEAPAPAQVGYRICTGLFQREVPAERIGPFTQLMHLLYGTSWGAVYGILQGTIEAPAIPAGILFGLAVWLAGYAILVPMRIYEPFWRYPAGTVLLEISYHFVYGFVIGVAFYGLGRI